ncbi:hypothetical protein [Bradyrhizobium sp. 930_D9_N1_4]|uniref:hypothetical protein n=1 Tax=Bradyrhizobium sp. 930_D9_N1_4 TaxID=3240374 RepID=UPI003F8CC6C0
MGSRIQVTGAAAAMLIAFRKTSDSESTMHRVSPKGVAIGNITDIVATYVVMLPPMVYFAIWSGLPVATIFKESTALYVSYVILGGACSVLGGYVSARIAGHDELLNGALSSILCIGGGIYAVIGGSAAEDLWMHLVFLPLSPALGALGGYLRSRQTARAG